MAALHRRAVCTGPASEPCGVRTLDSAAGLMWQSSNWSHEMRLHMLRWYCVHANVEMQAVGSQLSAAKRTALCSAGLSDSSCQGLCGAPQMWDADTMELVMEAPAAHGGARVNCAAVGPDGNLYTGGDDKVPPRADPRLFGLLARPVPRGTVWRSAARGWVACVCCGACTLHDEGRQPWFHLWAGAQTTGRGQPWLQNYHITGLAGRRLLLLLGEVRGSSMWEPETLIITPRCADGAALAAGLAQPGAQRCAVLPQPQRARAGGGAG